MNKLKIFVGITLSLLLTTLAVVFLVPQTPSMPISHQTLKITLKQDNNGNLTIENLRLDNLYPSNYQLKLTKNFLNIKIIGSSDKILFSGQVNNKVIIPPVDFGESGGTTTNQQAIFKQLDKIILYLPYYTSSRKIILTDDKGNQKLEVNLGNLKLPADYVRNLCGNGICDFNENLISCPKDCLHLR